MLILHSSAAYRDPVSSNMTALFSSLLVDALNEYAYNAEMAGIDYEVKNTINSVRVSLLHVTHSNAVHGETSMTQMQLK